MTAMKAATTPQWMPVPAKSSGLEAAGKSRARLRLPGKPMPSGLRKSPVETLARMFWAT